MKNVLLQELAPAMFHMEHSKNKMISLSSPANSLSLFAIFAVWVCRGQVFDATC
jgi:hypothetical protein